MAATRTTQQTTRSSQKSKPRPSIQRPQATDSIDTKRSITDLLKQKGSLTRGEITIKTGIPRTTVYDTLVSLLLSGLIEKYVERNGQRGRPSVYYQLI